MDGINFTLQFNGNRGTVNRVKEHIHQFPHGGLQSKCAGGYRPPIKIWLPSLGDGQACVGKDFKMMTHPGLPHIKQACQLQNAKRALFQDAEYVQPQAIPTGFENRGNRIQKGCDPRECVLSECMRAAVLS